MLSFSLFCVAALLAAILWANKQRQRKTTIVGTAWIIALLVGGAILWPGAMLVQRGLTALAMPIGLVWLGLIALMILSWQRANHVWRYGLLALTVLLTASSNRSFSKLLLDRLEGEHQREHALNAGDFDIIFLLGGGAGRGPEGQLNVSSSGDRVVLAARLFHARKTKRIACTGKVAATYWPEDRDPGHLSQELLREMAVPSESLVILGGRNTQEEMREIRAYLKTNQVARAGVITSAWHMRRSLRLARAVDLELTPLSADFRGGNVNWRDFSLVPEAGALADTGIAIKELIAGLVGR
jgi:uncharacterized SAM-binding protein YcdF (DUF218 family)